MIRLVILGAGTAIPRAGYSPAGHLVVVNGQPLLFDMGPGTVARLAAAGVDYRDLDQIFLTHLHSDHTLDLITLLQDFDSTPGWTRRKGLKLYGCYGLNAFYQRLMSAYPGIEPSTYSIQLNEMKAGATLQGEGWNLVSDLTGHTPDSLGYRLEAEGKSIVFSGDAVFSHGVKDLAYQADVFVCECSFPGDESAVGHLSAGDVGRIAQQAGVKRLVLVHLYPPAHQANLLEQVRKHFSGPMEIASDGLTILL